VSATRYRARGPRGPRERGVARGRVAPSGEDPAHPANPARPFRGAGSRAGSGGLTAPAAARPAGGRPALAGFCGGDGRAAVPTAPVVPGGPGEGWSAAAGGLDPAQGPHRTALTCRAVTLSNENALSRFRACPDPLPPACGPQRAAHGPGQGSQSEFPPYVGADGRPTQGPGVPSCQPDDPFPLVMPLVGPVGRNNRARLAPLGGSGAARPSGALRAIDSTACPRSWQAFGLRRLRRQSQPALVATQCDATWCRC
jgi:hypothetical protein